MKPALILVVIINIISTHALAYQPAQSVNKLKAKLLAKGKQTDTAAVNILNTIAEEFYESAPDSTVHYAENAFAIANKLNYTRGKADAYVQLASVNNFRGQYAAGTVNYNKALQLYRSNKDQLGVSKAFMGLGSIQDYLGNYTVALNYYEKALAIRKQLGNQQEVANSYAIIGITYDNKGQFTKALDNYFKSLNIDLKLNNHLAAADNYCNIGVVMQHLELWDKAMDYFNKANALWLRLDDKQGISTISQNIGEVLMSQKKFNEANTYFQKALKDYLILGDQDGISLVYYDLGIVNYHLQKTDSAIFYLKKSLESATANNIQYNMAYAYEGLALVYNLEKRYSEAYAHALSAQKLAGKLQSLNTQADATLQVSNALAGLKQFDKAYEQHRLYTSLRDSLKNDETLQKFASYNMAIDFENSQRKAVVKEAQLVKKIEQQRVANTIYAIVIVIITIMMIIYYNAKRKQLKANAMLAEKNREVLEQAEELNGLNTLKDRLISILAHDLRAPLSTLRGMFTLLTQHDITPEEFAEMVPLVSGKLEHTSDFLDTLLFWINSQVDNITDTTKNFCLSDVVKVELETLQDQLKQKNITAINSVTTGHVVMADPNSIRIVVHNFLTNSIKFSHENSLIEIKAQVINGEVLFMVKDHGIGMSTDQLGKLFKRKVESQPGTKNERGTGMGLIFCKDLVEKYNGRIWAKSDLNAGTELGFALASASSVVENSPKLV
ncbi:tetratricopeptide repeat-containing sensor histidine kinase [Mucilaginibacter terrenus]|uniref:tetratricopeptide repeat-containing sensor histidine kinase n=1 Tax=Mucilaginibacter terrenus TaxID=2482727 RepID=UPI00105901DD|nr:tetratricopeptide repeat protein [Mucilaginibacter terrenus]